MKLLALLAGAALLACAPAHAELVTNGGFETGDASGWTQTGDSLYAFVDGIAPHSGSFAFASGSPPSNAATLSQTLATVTGANHRVSFWVGNSLAASDDQPNAFAFDWDGGAAELLLNNADAFGYTEYVYNFVAASSSTELSFTFANFGGFWDFDDVSVTVVPEPAAPLLVGAALLACWLTRRRR